VGRLKIVVVMRGRLRKFEVQELRDGVWVPVYESTKIQAANIFCKSLKDWLVVDTSVN
jgi:hypothetical protein